MPWLTPMDGAVRLQLRVVPRAAHDRVEGALGDVLKIRLRAPPVEGQANAALVEFLADQLDLPRRAIVLEAGGQARLKRVRVEGLSADAVRRRLTGPR